MAYEEINRILEQIKNTERTDKVFNLWDQCRSIVHDNHMPTEVVTSLLRESGIDLNKVYPMGHDSKITVLTWLILSSRLNQELIEPLCKAGADVNLLGPLIYAATQGERSVEMVKLLLDAGANVNSTDQQGENVFHGLARDNRQPNIEILKILSARGLDTTAKNPDKETYLHVWLKHKAYGPERIIMLIQNDPKIQKHINTFDNLKNSPLHYATTGHEEFQTPPSPELVQVLLEHGANILARNGEGKTPVDLAQNNDAVKNVLNPFIEKANVAADNVIRHTNGEKLSIVELSQFQEINQSQHNLLVNPNYG